MDSQHVFESGVDLADFLVGEFYLGDIYGVVFEQGCADLGA